MQSGNAISCYLKYIMSFLALSTEMCLVRCSGKTQTKKPYIPIHRKLPPSLANHRNRSFRKVAPPNPPKVSSPSIVKDILKKKRQSADKSKKKFTTSSLDSDTDRSRRKGSRSPRLTGSRTSGTIPKLMSSSTASKGIRSSLSTQEEGFCEPCGSESVCRTICVEQVDRSAEADFPEDENQPE